MQDILIEKEYMNFDDIVETCKEFGEETVKKLVERTIMEISNKKQVSHYSNTESNAIYFRFCTFLL